MMTRRALLLSAPAAALVLALPMAAPPTLVKMLAVVWAVTDRDEAVALMEEVAGAVLSWHHSIDLVEYAGFVLGRIYSWEIEEVEGVYHVLIRVTGDPVLLGRCLLPLVETYTNDGLAGLRICGWGARDGDSVLPKHHSKIPHHFQLV